MKRILIAGIVSVLIGGAVAFSQKSPLPEQAGRVAAGKLFQSLSETQKKIAAKEWDDKSRSAIRFPTEGTGTPISQMSEEQKKLVDAVLQSMLSEYGLKRCQEMGGTGRVTFYGNPEAGERFACRIDKNNHLTLIYTASGKEGGGEFGPIILGAKGAGIATVWVEEDKLAQELATALKPEDAKKLKGRATPIGELSDKPKAQAVKLLEQRLAVFSAGNRKILDEAIEQDGGVDKLSLFFEGDASKSIDEDGRYHWSITGPSFSCTWRADGKKHPHMTLKAKRVK